MLFKPISCVYCLTCCTDWVNRVNLPSAYMLLESNVISIIYHTSSVRLLCLSRKTNDAEMNRAEVALWLLFALPAKAVTIHLPRSSRRVCELLRSKEGNE